MEFPYHDDLRRIELNLNELPRGNRNGCVTREKVSLLFASDGCGGLAIH